MANPVSSIPHSLLTYTQINEFHFLNLNIILDFEKSD